ncbi:MAG: hypothetical protein AAGN66_30205, partial [Acidobacteriota bacterium]
MTKPNWQSNPVHPAAVLSAMAFSFLAAVHPSIAQAPEGDPFQINTTTFGSQRAPSIDGTGGEFLVVWKDPGLRAQRLDAGGRPLAAEFELLEETPYRHRIARQPDGDVLVVWRTIPDPVYARLLDAEGNPKTEALEISPFGDLTAVTTDTDGRFVIVYEEYEYLDFKDIRVRRLDADGQFLGADMSVGIGRSSQVAATDDGGFVVAWTFEDSVYTFTYETLVRKYNAEGQPANPARVIQESVPDHLEVAPTPGGFAVVWATSNIETQKFDFNAQPQGPVVEVVPPTSKPPRDLDAATDSDGRLLIAWPQNLQVFSRSVAEDGSTLGGTFRLDAGTLSFEPRVASVDTGRFLAAFVSDTSAGGDTSGTSIQGRLLVDEDLFADGFEGGGPLAWGHVTGVPGCLPAAQLDCGDPVVRGDTNGPGTTRVLENYPCQL